MEFGISTIPNSFFSFLTLSWFHYPTTFEAILYSYLDYPIPSVVMKTSLSVNRIQFQVISPTNCLTLRDCWLLNWFCKQNDLCFFKEPCMNLIHLAN